MANYQFTTLWKVPGTREDIYRLLEQAEELPRWWPSVYLDVNIINPRQPDGVGKIVEFYTNSWLPYTLRWKFQVTKTNFPHGFSLLAFGDFVGKGIWTFSPYSPGTCLVKYVWCIRAEKPILKFFTPLLRPLFSLNHHWAMQKGLESLKLAIKRRKAGTAEDRNHIPAPPGPTFPHNLINNRIFTDTSLNQSRQIYPTRTPISSAGTSLAKGPRHPT